MGSIGHSPSSNQFNASGASPRRIAVVGSGAVGYSVLSTLLRGDHRTELTLFDIGKTIAPEPTLSTDERDSIAELYDQQYRNIWKDQPRKFPPPKTHFSESIAKRGAGPKRSVFESNTLGGLTNYWGGTMLPLTDREMKGWPISRETLWPYYQSIAERVGLSAKDDSLNRYFQESFATRPGISTSKMLSGLDQVVNEHGSGANVDYQVVSGLNRIALETRQDHENACVYCGECMAGCFRSSVFSSRTSIKSYLDGDSLTQIDAEVQRVDLKTKQLILKTSSGETTTDHYDQIILAAGAIGTSEILMRTFGIEEGPIMTDNAVYVFPILYLGTKAVQEPQDQYLSQCNLIFACIPRQSTEHFAQAQIYPNFDYLWRYNIPPSLWPAIKPLARHFRSRLFWARLYLHSDYSQRYALYLKNGKSLKIETDETNLQPSVVDKLMRSFKRAANHQGFWIPPIPPIRQKTNSHYGATFPYGGSQLSIGSDNQVSNGVFVADSTTFPNSPAVSPTFAMMANAARISHGLLDLT